VELTINWNIL